MGLWSIFTVTLKANGFPIVNFKYNCTYEIKHTIYELLCRLNKRHIGVIFGGGVGDEVIRLLARTITLLSKVLLTPYLVGMFLAIRRGAESKNHNYKLY